MSPIETEEVLSEAQEGAGEEESAKLVPVAESIRYRRRAQSAEKQAAELAEQLASAQSRVAEASQKLEAMEREQQLMRRLAAEGAVDLEAAVILARARMEGDGELEFDSVVEQLKREKCYMFAGGGGVAPAGKTAGVKERGGNARGAVERAAERAANSGDRRDIHEYLRLRRNFV